VGTIRHLIESTSIGIEGLAVVVIVAAISSLALTKRAVSYPFQIGTASTFMVAKSRPFHMALAAERVSRGPEAPNRLRSNSLQPPADRVHLFSGDAKGLPLRCQVLRCSGGPSFLAE
jgi:hypothetical protein